MRDTSKSLRKPRNTKVDVQSYIHKDTGEVIPSDRLAVNDVAVKFSNYSKVESFVKYFYGNIALMKELGFPVHIANEHILSSILQNMNYAKEGQALSISKRDKDIWADELQVSDSTINRCLDDLIKCGYILRIARGLYMANPYLFGKGNDMDIAELRERVVILERNEAYNLPARVEYKVRD